MDTGKVPESLRGLSITSLIFVFLGGIFCWWIPLGIVMALSGLLIGFIDWNMARRRSVDRRLSAVTIWLALAVLTLDIIIALGLRVGAFEGQ
jgi:hypothetical protein